MRNSKLIYRLGFIAALATLGACGGGSSDTTQQGQAGSGQSGGSAGSTPGAGTSSALEDELLTLVNAARAQSRNCGTKSMPAVSPLSWNEQLEAAAQGHSQYMKDTETFSHTGAGNSSAGDRATAAGYSWRTVGENIAAGYPGAAAVMQGWINSDGHCENLMGAAFTEIAVVNVDGDSGNTYSNYWTMVLAAPR